MININVSFKLENVFLPWFNLKNLEKETSITGLENTVYLILKKNIQFYVWACSPKGQEKWVVIWLTLYILACLFRRAIHTANKYTHTITFHPN